MLVGSIEGSIILAGNIVATLGVCCVIYCYLVGSVVVDVCSVLVHLNRWLSLFSVGRNKPYCLVVSLTPCFSSIVLVFISSLLLSLCWAPCWLLVVNLDETITPLCENALPRFRR